MKLTEFKKLIREEIQKVLNEDDFSTRVSTLNRIAAGREAASPYDTLSLVAKYLDTKYPGVKYVMTKPGDVRVNLQIKVRPYIAMLQMAGDAKWEGWVQSGTEVAGDELSLNKMVSKDPKEAFKKIKPWIDTAVNNMKSKSY